jgi:hypothetical protein
METRRVLWAFKMYAQETGVWDVAHLNLTPTLPHDVPEDTWLFPGVIVHAMLPHDIGIAPEFLHGMELEAGNPSWLTAELIEAAFLATRPNPLPAGTEYLNLMDTSLLRESFRWQLKDNAKELTGMSVKALLQYK